MTDKERIKYLEGLVPEDVDIDDKYWDNFDKYATYMGNGVYQWKGILATCTRELFLMGALRSEKVEFEEV